RIVEIGEDLDPGDAATFDASGAIVAPGFVDMHVHLREPGFPQKETIATGTAAAANGGFTAVACMPNTEPALDDPGVIERLTAKIAGEAVCRVYPIGAITRERRGRVPCDFAALARAGAVAFSDDGTSVADAGVLRTAAMAARTVAGVFISHCEDESLKAHGVMNEGAASRALGVAASPSVAEDVVVARDLLIAADTRKAWHVAHASTRRALELVRWARSIGAAATCEVTPHHLTFTDEAVAELGTSAKVNPPLRTLDDVRALRDGVRDGTVDVLATDHAPHTAQEKAEDLERAAVGFSGLEIAIGAYADALEGLPLHRFVALLSTNPARILGVPGGTLAVGSAADVTIFADRPWIVDPARFASKGRSTPFAGRRLPRRALAVVVGGRLRAGFQPAPG
ncbi:MAG TPA: dihydroorotase, partial [Candidatus Acidoferrales bacterium]|nr:dihydroorotase [Candidatus Acidoferrales bacterium]